MAVLIKIRRDNSGNWAAYNPTLALGEPAYITDLNQFCIGDGSTPFGALPKFKTLEQIDLSQYALTADMLTAIQGASDVLQGQITAHQTSIDAISAQQLADNAHLGNIDNQLTTLQTFTNSTNNWINTFDAQLIAHGGQLAGHDASLNNFQVNMNAVISRLDLHDIDISALQSQVSLLQGATLGEIDGGGAAG